MGLRFILGRPGTGKTTLCLSEIGEMLTCGAPLYYLVPEQFSLQSEKLLLTNRRAATQVQVLSFNRLAYRLFATFGGQPSKMADDLGKQMLLRKVLFQVFDNLTYYKSAVDKHGFVESLSDTITEMNHYRVTSDDLRARAQTAENEAPAFAAKMQDIAMINERYRQLVDGRYLLTDDMLEILCGKLDELAMQSLPLLDNAHFWVDGFSGFTPQEQQVLKHLMKRAERVSVTLTTAADSRLTPPQITREKLEKLASDNRIKSEPIVYMKENFRHANAPGLAAFVDGFRIYKAEPLCPTVRHCEEGVSPTKQSTGHTLLESVDCFASLAMTGRSQFRHNTSGGGGDITIIPAPDRYASVYTAAAKITEWVTQHGYNFRDIAILCGDRSHYEKILQTTFDRLNIPLFVDTEIDIHILVITELIRATQDIIVRK